MVMTTIYTRLVSLPLLLRHLSVLRRAIQALGAQTHVDFVFEVRAHAYRLPHEALGLAFVERGHDLFAAWEEIVRARAVFEWIILERPTDIVLSVEVRMHDCWRNVSAEGVVEQR